MTKTVIAIDGTSASGKSTNARLLAQELGYWYVDTGRMYRTFAWRCLRSGLDLNNAKILGRSCLRWRTEIVADGNQLVLKMPKTFQPEALRTAAVASGASKVSSVPAVRRWMRRIQRSCISFGNLVMEGRDIGTNVFPETDFKYYLDAGVKARAERRGSETVVDIQERDTRDSQRGCAPLMLGLGARYIDTSALTIEATFQLILADFKEKSNQSVPLTPVSIPA
jgi:cytidylate kinase